MEEVQAARKLDRLGLVLVAAGAAATAWMPFIIVKANRIASGKPLLLTQLLSQPVAIALLCLLLATAMAAIFVRNPVPRLAVATLCIAILLLAIGLVATAATPIGSASARITPGGAFWALLAVVGLVISDALVKI